MPPQPPYNLILLGSGKAAELGPLEPVRMHHELPISYSLSNLPFLSLFSLHNYFKKKSIPTNPDSCNKEEKPSKGCLTKSQPPCTIRAAAVSHCGMKGV